MHATHRLVLLGPALIAALVISPSASSQAAAVPGPAKAVVANTPQHAAELQVLAPPDPYNAGMREGHRQGIRDARLDCSLQQKTRSGSRQHFHRRAEVTDFTRGYNAGYEDGYFSICGR
jgi:hypothetical protein